MLSSLAPGDAVRSSVSMCGHREGVSALLLAADLFAVPIDFAGFPFALLEAIAYGESTVFADVNGMPEILNHGSQSRLSITVFTAD